jgi:hypothetical protein
MPKTRLGLSYPILDDTPDIPRDVKQLADDVDRLLHPSDSSWKFAAFANGWTDTNVASFGRLRYKKLIDGTVHILGRVNGQTAVGPQQVVCTLPFDYRPAYTIPFLGLCTATLPGDTEQKPYMGWLELRTDGNLAVIGPTGGFGAWMVNTTYWAG